MESHSRIEEKEIALTDAATIAISADDGHRFKVTIASNRTLGSPSAGYNGQQIVVTVKNSDTSDHTLTLTSGTDGFRFGSDITALSDIVAGKTDYITAIYNAADSRWDVVGYSKGY